MSQISRRALLSGPLVGGLVCRLESPRVVRYLNLRSPGGVSQLWPLNPRLPKAGWDLAQKIAREIEIPEGSVFEVVSLRTRGMEIVSKQVYRLGWRLRDGTHRSLPPE